MRTTFDLREDMPAMATKAASPLTQGALVRDGRLVTLDQGPVALHADAAALLAAEASS